MLQEGDVIGCGLDQNRTLFWNLNSKIIKTKTQAYEPNLRPALGLGAAGIKVKINLKASNPLSPCLPSSFDFRKNHILPWAPQLGRPIGNVQLQEPFNQNTLMFKFPPDVLKLLMGESIGIQILLTCRQAYQAFSPLCTWFDPHALSEQVIGGYLDHRFRIKRDPHSLAFEIKADGTVRALVYYFPKGQRKIHCEWLEGTWDLTPTHLRLAYITQCNADLNFPISILATLKCATQDEPFQKIRPPISAVTTKVVLCGIPLQKQQMEGKDCCHEYVSSIVDSIWNTSYNRLGDGVKEAISEKLSLRCMQPGGMSNIDIEIAAAEEIAACREWKECLLLDQSTKSLPTKEDI